MSLPASAIPYNLEEYFILEQRLAREEPDAPRHEYVLRHIVPRPVESHTHDLILNNLTKEIEKQIRQKRACHLYKNTTRLEVARAFYTYPDAMIVCGEPRVSSDNTLRNPTVIFEILSAPTRNYDLGGKITDYRMIPSLQSLVYIYDDRNLVTHIFRRGDMWGLKDHYQGTIEIKSIECVLSLTALYQGVDMPWTENDL
jgi:Uma2 family endonuclease